MNTDCFLSYAREDVLYARLICAMFRSHNLNPWFDHYQIRPTDPTSDVLIEPKIRQAIQSAPFFVVLVSRASLGAGWVRRELEIALERRRQGEKIHLVGIVIEEGVESQLDAPWSQLRLIRIAEKEIRNFDTLRELREEIGARKPTFMSNPRPAFIKQIEIAKYPEHIEMCTGDSLRLWHINGGHSVSSCVLPALRRSLKAAAENRVERALHCRVMLVDSALLSGVKEEPIGLPSHLVQAYFDDRLDDSGFFVERGPHHDLVRKTIEGFRDLVADFPIVKCEFRLTRQIPAGRTLFLGETGFFSPFLSDAGAYLPVLVFDANSPFHTTVSDHFEKAWREARPHTDESD